MNAENVNAGKPKIAGAIFRAPLGTELPTDATSELDAAFKELGYASNEGVTNSNTGSSNSIRAWGGDEVLVTQSEKTDTFTFTLIESTNVDTLKAVFGDKNVTGESTEAGITVNVNATELDYASYVIDMILRGGVPKRIVIPSGKPSVIGEVSYTDTSAIGYPVTLSTQPDEKGNTHYEYIGGAVI